MRRLTLSLFNPYLCLPAFAFLVWAFFGTGDDDRDVTTLYDPKGTPPCPVCRRERP